MVLVRRLEDGHDRLNDPITPESAFVRVNAAVIRVHEQTPHKGTASVVPTRLPGSSTEDGVPGSSTEDGVPGSSTEDEVPGSSTEDGVPGSSTEDGVPGGSTEDGVPTGIYSHTKWGTFEYRMYHPHPQYTDRFYSNIERKRSSYFGTECYAITVAATRYRACVPAGHDNVTTPSPAGRTGGH